jgi:hypothetical protein
VASNPVAEETSAGPTDATLDEPTATDAVEGDES